MQQERNRRVRSTDGLAIMKRPTTLDEIIKEHSERLRCYHCGTDVEKIAHIVNDYHDTAVRAMSDVKEFRDDLQVYLRAIALVLDMTANASTHREKNARLRGACELLESAIGKLRESSFEFMLGRHGMSADIFRSDYPTRHLVERIHTLEDALKAAAKNGNGEPATEMANNKLSHRSDEHA